MVALSFIFIACVLILDIYALNCQSGGGPKQKDLKKIYTSCIKQQETKNSSNNQGYYDQDWKDNRGQNPRNFNKKDGRRGMDDRSGGRDDNIMGRRNDRMGDENDRPNRNTRIDDRMWVDRDDRSGSDVGNRHDSNSRYDTTGRGNSNHDDRYNSNNKWSMGRDDRMHSRDDYGQSNEYESDTLRYPFRSSTQSSQRSKREKRKEMNSGHRSQYNPNAQRPMDSQNSNRFDEKNNSGRNNSKDNDNACVLHCFLEELEMIGENGMPDKYLVTHAITKDVKNEDLRDFLQESIDECFQILYNENTEEKCEFSKNLMICLSEKGKANCDDWRDDIKF